MELKIFRAKAMSDAMQAVKAALGADAVIVGSKPLTALGAAVGFEITAHAPVKLSRPVADAGSFRSTPWAPSAGTPADLPPTRPAPRPRRSPTLGRERTRARARTSTARAASGGPRHHQSPSSREPTPPATAS